MKFDINEVREDDVIITPLYIGDMDTDKVDAFCEKTLNVLKDTFKCEVVVYPVRRTEGFDFTIIRNASSKTYKSLKKVDTTVSKL
jgi:hypothetical protein